MGFFSWLAKAFIDDYEEMVAFYEDDVERLVSGKTSRRPYRVMTQGEVLLKRLADAWMETEDPSLYALGTRVRKARSKATDVWYEDYKRDSKKSDKRAEFLKNV